MIILEIVMLANVSLEQTHRRPHVGAVSRPKLNDQPDDFQSESLQGFIKHPKRFPLHLRSLRFWQSKKINIDPESNTGMTFSSKEYQKPGSIIEVTIPTRKEVHQFMAKS